MQYLFAFLLLASLLAFSYAIYGYPYGYGYLGHYGYYDDVYDHGLYDYDHDYHILLKK
ncbi:unnamed protein product [Larinioides sclopetarius]|uniref:Uncharacterized protein n=1 Tax=Larinioides sclopetarius TaxID=280406 RepID=A0AAV2BY79_9ARAC